MFFIRIWYLSFSYKIPLLSHKLNIVSRLTLIKKDSGIPMRMEYLNLFSKFYFTCYYLWFLLFKKTVTPTPMAHPLGTTIAAAITIG